MSAGVTRRYRSGIGLGLPSCAIVCRSPSRPREIAIASTSEDERRPPAHDITPRRLRKVTRTSKLGGTFPRPGSPAQGGTSGRLMRCPRAPIVRPGLGSAVVNEQPTNLPARRTALIGRERDIAAVRDLVLGTEGR